MLKAASCLFLGWLVCAIVCLLMFNVRVTFPVLIPFLKNIFFELLSEAKTPKPSQNTGA